MTDAQELARRVEERRTQDQQDGVEYDAPTDEQIARLADLYTPETAEPDA